MKFEMSICTYQSGDFDVMLRDATSGEEVVFSGNKKLTDDEFDMVGRIAPACVWTPYESKDEG